MEIRYDVKVRFEEKCSGIFMYIMRHFKGEQWLITQTMYAPDIETHINFLEVNKYYLEVTEEALEKFYKE